MSGVTSTPQPAAGAGPGSTRTPTQTAAPLVVWLGSSMWTFPPTKEVRIGRADNVDIRIEFRVKQAISRVHMVVRTDAGRWVAIDNSRNGIYVGGSKVNSVPIDNDVRIRLASPDGPELTFRTTSRSVPAIRSAESPRPASRLLTDAGLPAERLTPPRSVGTSGGQSPRPPTPPSRQTQRGPVDRAQRPPAGLGPTFAPPSPPQPLGSAAEPDLIGRMSGVVKRVVPQRTPTPPAGAVTIGRSPASSIHVGDPLVSRTHAYLLGAPTGTQLYDNASNNGTFVNGTRVSAATLRAGDVVTVGNTDLTFSGGLTLAPRVTAPRAGGLQAHQLGLTVDGHYLLTNVSFTARLGTLTAVIGPSGAGKSTLIRLLGGATRPTFGAVTFDGHNVHAQYATMRSRIGMVPQDDVVHRALTVTQALTYAAELRLPPDTTQDDRAAVVNRVLGELELVEHRAKRVDKLSGGQRKRASVALELLTGPSLLILDEPTSGLDPALDRQVMAMLRRLADGGRTVIVVTHSLTYLSMCDQVLLLAPGGKTAYAGPPSEISAAMGTSDWADIFAWVSANPDAAHAAFLTRNPDAAQPASPAGPAGPLGEPARTDPTQQLKTLARRQKQLIFADRGYMLFLALLPFILGALSLAVPGNVGLGVASASGGAPNEPNQLLILLNIAAVFMGTALTIRDLIGERTIFRREQSVGLSAAAYLASKIVIYSLAAAIQTAVVTLIVVVGKGGPTQGALAFGSPVIDLYFGLAATAIVSAVVGLLLSSLARSTEQILPMLVVVIMLSIVFSGGMIPVTGRVLLQQASWFLPARWGFAASASTVDLLKAAPLMTSDDPLWRHELKWWLLDIFVLMLLGVVAVAAVGARLRLPAQDVAGPGAAGSGRVEMRIVLGVIAALLMIVFLAGLSIITRGGGTRGTPTNTHIPSTDVPTPPTPSTVSAAR